ncbi:MAG TPA: hypothetical protein VG122_00815 [Gemmata sp.]|nr:hypothetical protein [Gemmata sp.]
MRNVSKEPINFSYGRPQSEPEITDAKGKNVIVIMPHFLGVYVAPTEKVVKPGETVLFKREVAVEEVPNGKAVRNSGVRTPTIPAKAGKYKIGFDEDVQSTLTLSTGLVEFEVLDEIAKDPQKTNEAVNTEKPSQMDEKEGITIWKEAGGFGLPLRRTSGVPHRGEGQTCRLTIPPRPGSRCRDTYVLRS